MECSQHSMSMCGLDDEAATTTAAIYNSSGPHRCALGRGVGWVGANVRARVTDGVSVANRGCQCVCMHAYDEAATATAAIYSSSGPHRCVFVTYGHAECHQAQSNCWSNVQKHSMPKRMRGCARASACVCKCAACARMCSCVRGWVRACVCILRMCFCAHVCLHARACVAHACMCAHALILMSARVYAPASLSARRCLLCPKGFVMVDKHRTLPGLRHIPCAE